MRYWVQLKFCASDVSMIITDYSCELIARMFNDKVHLLPTGQWFFTVTFCVLQGKMLPRQLGILMVAK